MQNIFVAGHRGMVGQAILRQLEASGLNAITADRSEVDLLDQNAVRLFLNNKKPDAIILAAAKVGGILANNTFPAEFIYQNLMIETNVIHQAHLTDIQHLLFLGSSCIYPKDTPQPIQEDALLSGTLEPTNEPYAIAKIAGLKLCESYNRQYGRDYRSIMPTNLYGPGDLFHPENSHVIPALLLKFHNALDGDFPSISIWGSGNQRREFLHVDDMAAAALFVMNLDKQCYNKNHSNVNNHINIGTGRDMSIAQLADMISEITGYNGRIIFDTSKSDGTPRKHLCIKRLSELGWSASIDLNDGIRRTWDWYLNNRSKLRTQ